MGVDQQADHPGRDHEGDGPERPDLAVADPIRPERLDRPGIEDGADPAQTAGQDDRPRRDLGQVPTGDKDRRPGCPHERGQG